MVLRGTGIRRDDLIGCLPSHTPVLSLFEHSIARFTSLSAFEIIALGIRRRRDRFQSAPRVRHARSTCSIRLVHRLGGIQLMDYRLEPPWKGPRVKRLVTRLPREALPDGGRRVLWSAITTSTISR